jgi:hypothetical protein
MARKKYVQTFDYECTLTGESFTTTKKTESTDDLVSVKGYYEMNPEEDDRPEAVLKKLGLTKEDLENE